MITYLLGLDAGGTKTIAVVIDHTKRELGRGSGGPGNYHSAGTAGALAGIQEAIGEALEQAGLNVAQIDAACFALGGMDRPEDVRVGESFAHTVLPGSRAIVCNDSLAALYSGTGKAEGVVVVAGTGSNIYGFAPDGRQAHAGGWGYRLGDEGSGWWLAQQALFAIVRAHDGCGPATELTWRFLSCLNLSRPADLLDWAYGSEWTRVNVASLAPFVQDAAQAGDGVAQKIVHVGVEALALAVQVVAQKLALDQSEFGVVLSGSLFRSEFYREAMQRTLSERVPMARPMLPQVSAAVGAAWLALDTWRREKIS